jgi:hypothetical protein
MASALRDSAVDLIGIRGRKFTRIVGLAALVACFVAVTGCGGDDEDTEATSAPAATETGPAATTPAETTETQTEQQPAQTETAQTGTAPAGETSPEPMPGGAGDEEPARTLALFTARGGRITPRLVRVPAFIAVKVELRSADGATYSLRFGDATVTAGGALSSASTTIDGLRPGQAIVGRPEGAGNRVRISATAEPGP